MGEHLGAGKDGEQSRDLRGPWQGLALPITLFRSEEEGTMETSWPGRRHRACGQSFSK